MPLPTSISDLSQTAASNSPSGSETPNLIDDYFQVYAAYIAQLRDGPGFVSGVKSNVLGTVSLPAYSFVGDTDTGMFSPAANTLAWSVGGSEGVRLDSSGNLGLGVTPSAWQSSYKAIEVGNSLAMIGGSSAADLYFNAFINSGGSFRYRTNDSAAAYSMATGQHRWFTAPSGTAGAAITFTQVMTLDSSGNLIQRPPTTPPTLTTNGELVITPTSNTNVRISYRGSDGVTRVANLTLS